MVVLLAIIESVLQLVAGSLALLAGYLLVLTVAAVFARKHGPSAGPATRRFAILIPAHDEQALIGRLLASLHRLEYPADRFEICVVADNCTDATASVARSLAARVYERVDLVEQAKGFALRWLLAQLNAEGRTFEAYVVLDADSIVAPNFLRSMDARLELGSQVVQAYYSVLNSTESTVAGLRYAALAAIHYLRPLGRSAFGLSCGLKGNGMCFSAPVLERFSWQWFALAEDVEFHLALVMAGIKVDFAPETTVSADMPTTLKQATSQNARWEGGRLELLRRHVPALLKQGLRHASPLRLDAALEQLIPPLSVPFGLGVLCLLSGVVLGASALVALSVASLAGQICYLLAGMVLVRAPWRTYAALAAAPVYIAWKVGLYVRALTSSQSTVWVRTARAAPHRVSRP